MTLFLALLLLFSPASSSMQTTEQHPQAAAKNSVAGEKPARPHDLLELIALAHAVPPEFGADVLIRVAHLAQVKDPEWKRELLEDAFYLAAGVKEPVRRRALLTLNNGNSRSNYRSQGFDFNFDALSLQARVLQDLVALPDSLRSRAPGAYEPGDATLPDEGRKLALRLLRDVRIPQFPALGCDDVFSYLPDDFYTDAVPAVAEHAFSPEEVEGGARSRLLHDYLSSFTSSAQIYPLAEMIRGVKLTPAEFADLVDLYAAKLATLQPDARWSGTRGPTELALACTRNRVSALPLLNAYRSYLVKAFSRRCSDQPGFNPEAWDQRRARLVFEDPQTSDAQVPPIAMKEIKTEVIESHIEEPAFWQDPLAKRLFATASDLRGNQTLRADAAQWESRFREFVGQVDAWTGSSEKSSADYFHQKAALFQYAHQAAVTPAQRETLLRSWVLFLAGSELKQTSPSEWFVQANPLIQILLSAKASEREKLLGVVRNAQESVLWMYAELGRLNAQ